MLEAHSSGQRNSQWASAGQRRRGSEPGESEWEEDGGGTRSRSTSISTTSGYSDSVNEERVVSSSLRLRSNKRKPSSENNSVKQKWPKETAKEDPSEQPDTVVPKEDEMLLTEERLADSSADELIIIDGDDAPDMTQKVIQTIVKQEPETEAVEPPRLPEQGCNTELVKENSSDSKGPYGHIPVEELQISQGTQFIRKIEKSDNLFRDPNCSHLGQVAHGEALVQNVPEIDLDSTKKYAAATVHFLDNQLDRLRNLLDETAKERECFRNQNEAMLITIQRMEKQLVEYQQKPNQEELDEKGLECGSTEVVEDIRAGDPSLEEMKMHCQNMEQERDTLTQQLQDAVKRLESCSLEKDQLKGQLSELEQEREQLRSDYEKMKQDVKTSTKRGEDFYWTKKAAAAYRYSELELMRNEIGKLKGEKLSLEEKLNEAQQWIALQKEARVPSTSQECVQVNSALAKLKSLRINLGHLLACVLPHLDLRDINYETNSIDDILEKVIEENKL
uniref:Uncharacterized protein n=2 Tax=Callorhinchus milii TaxID=7868 RepID=A0A4W3GRT0_CALMI